MSRWSGSGLVKIGFRVEIESVEVGQDRVGYRAAKEEEGGVGEGGLARFDLGASEGRTLSIRLIATGGYVSRRELDGREMADFFWL